MKVYLVNECNDPEDWDFPPRDTIIAVFDTKEKAEKFLRNLHLEDQDDYLTTLLVINNFLYRSDISKDKRDKGILTYTIKEMEVQ